MLVTEKSFYSLNPDGDFATGDIWMRLPSFGLLKQPQISGLVVTPACDLANCKTETITYAPIVPIHDFLLMPEFMDEIIRQTNDCLRNIGLNFQITGAKDFHVTKSAQIQALEALTLDKSKSLIRLRCYAGYKLIAAANDGGTSRSEIIKLIAELFGATNWEKIKAKIIRNSYRSDLYFVPPDYQQAEWSAVPIHSVVLLRYLITVPIYFLDEAYIADERDWSSRREKLIGRNLHWCEQCHRDLPPLRSLRLAESFLGDLLTKLVGIYVRLGAPDLEATTLNKIEKEIC